MSLTDHQQELVATFHEITQLEDNELIVQILRQNNWNVDQAVNNYVAGVDLSPSNEPTSSSSEDQQVWRNVDDSRQQSESNQNWLVNAIFNPLKTVFFARPAVLNPEADTRQFVNDFNAKYGYQHPTFQLSSYQNAVVQAFRQHKMLLVYIHSPLHEDTSAFCENALCSQNITRYIDENTVFWSGSVWDPEAYSLSTQLKASTFPFLALLVCQSERVVQVIDRIQGITEEGPFMERLTSVVGLANPVASRIRNDVQRREEANQLRAEQDREYREAEETDRREREKREAEAHEKRLAEEAAQQAQQLQEAIELSKRLSHEATVTQTKSSLKLEPADGPDSATIRFMLPKSSKITRRFHREDTVEYLNDFLVVHFHEAGTGVTHFSLSTHSKQELTDMSATLETVGLHPRGMLYVTDLDA